mgnify:FL=1
MKYTHRQFIDEFPNDAACLAKIMELRCGKEPVCAKCGKVSQFTPIQGRRAYACSCGYHVYPCAGTVFEKSSTSLQLWFHAMYLMTSTRNGVSAKELQRQLGMTYKCAWRMGHEIRKLMAERNKLNGPMSGHVEVDETYVGGKAHGKGRGPRAGGKTIVLGMLQRGGHVKGQIGAGCEAAHTKTHHSRERPRRQHDQHRRAAFLRRATEPRLRTWQRESQRRTVR